MKRKYLRTKEVHHKAIVVTVDVGCGVRLELDGDVGRGGVELEAGPCAAILAQDLGCEVVAIVEGQQVVFPHVEAVKRIEQIESLSTFYFTKDDIAATAFIPLDRQVAVGNEVRI